MTVTVVCDVLGEENNGTTIAAMNLIKALKQRGHTVRIVCGDEKRRGEEGFYVLPQINFGIFNGYVRKNGVAPAKVNMDIIRSAISGADAVHIMTPFFVGKAALKEAKRQGLTVTAGFHCQAENLSSHLFLMNCHGFNKAVYKYFYRKFYRNVDCIHYPTQFIRDVFEKECGHKTQGRVISNGVNARFVRKEKAVSGDAEDKFILLSTGRYSREKSHKVLIKAVALSKYADKIQLILAGDGPLKSELEALAARTLKNQPVFRFFGRDEMVDTINSADLYVHPAEIEIESIACLEAITCGLVPVISNSERSAARYFALREDNLFEAGNAENLAKKIDYWLDDPQKRAERSLEYSGFTKKFSQEYCMDEMEKMIIETAAEHAAS